MAQQQEGGQTSFNSYTFTYNWRIDDLETKFLSSRFSTFSSGSFSSPTGVRPSTSWMLTVFTDEDTDILDDIPLSSPAAEQSLSATLKRLPYQPPPQCQQWSEINGYSQLPRQRPRLAIGRSPKGTTLKRGITSQYYSQ